LANDREAVFAITVLDKLEIAVKTSSSACDAGGMRCSESPSPRAAGSQRGICYSLSTWKDQPFY